MLQATLSLFTAVLATGSSQLDEKTLHAAAPESAVERGSPALFSWGDVDGDARLDLAAVSAEGVLQLLVNAGEGRFEDVTERVGLSGIANAALALWADYDGDGRLDLFVGVRSGASRLFHNEGGIFIDMSAGSGLACEGAVQSAQWLDHDGDGRLDLFVVTAERNELFRGLEGGFFELAELPLAGAVKAPGPGGFLPGSDGADAKGGDAGGPRTPAAPGASSDRGSTRPGGSRGDSVSFAGAKALGNPIVLGPTPGGLTPLPVMSAGACAISLQDAMSLGPCLSASATPTLGMLYPISANLFVAVGGNVGIGTTTPTARLEVAGTARVTDTLTLAPAGDQALNVSTGSIYKGGALFIHTKGGFGNTALGFEALPNVTAGPFGYYGRNTASGFHALRFNTTGSYNTASGAFALRSNTTGNANTACGASALLYNTGSHNTACGADALTWNTTGFENTASGYFALHYNTTGFLNTASGHQALLANTTGTRNTANGALALRSNTTGYRNTASGYRALYFNTNGDRNIALGYRAGQNLTTGNDNIAIGHQGVAAESATIRLGTAGTHTRAFVAGIRGVTTGVADAIPVLVDSAGQLGTVSSSRRFKEEIEDMGDRTERLLQLRPVVFRYKPEVQSGERPLEYGLIAEEVAEVFPELVVYDDEGKPFTVKYHLLSSMLLNELKEQAHQLQEQSHQLKELHERFGTQEARVAALEGQRAATGTRPETP